MLYRRSDKKSFLSSKNVFVIFVVMVVMLAGALDRSFVVAPFQELAISVRMALVGARDAPLDWLGAFGSKRQLASENRLLKDQFTTLSAFCMLQVEGLEADNRELEKALARRTSQVTDETFTTAFVIGKPPVSPYGTIIIDQGRRSEIEAGNPVLVASYLLGIIETANEEYSLVRLFGEKGDKRIIEVGDKRVPLHAEGLGSGAYLAEYVNKDDDVGGQTAWLADYPLWKYAVVLKAREDSASKYEVKLSSPINIFEISTVDVVRHEDK